MRTLRRSLALLLHLLLLQATVLGGGAACVARPTGGVPAASGEHQGMRHGERPAAHHAGHDADQGDRAPDGPSGAPIHCGVAAACLTPALANRPAPLPLSASAPPRARATQDAAPRSATLAPEPPPPRG